MQAENKQIDDNESAMEKAGHKRMVRQSRSATTGSRLQYYTSYSQVADLKTQHKPVEKEV